MANNYTSLKNSYNNAENFKNFIAETDFNVVTYVFLGNSIPTSNSDIDIYEIEDTVSDEKTVWNNMFFAKKIIGSDLQLVIPRYDWSSGTIYKQFDDKSNLVSLIESTDDKEPMYIITDDLNVYKCLCNDVSSPSIIKPIGNYTSFDGFITTPDGYIWKFMYNIKPSNKFLTDEWIPVPTSVYELEFGTSELNVIDNLLIKIIVTNRGTGYINSTLTLTNSFNSGCTEITVNDISNVNVNMTISGTGISPNTYVISVDTIYNVINLSTPTFGSSNIGNTVQCLTRINLEGDGNDDAEFLATIVNTEIQKITVISRGTNYTTANVFIYGTGTGAEARAVFPPKFGHGFNPAKELGCSNVFINKLIGSPDSTEDGLIYNNTSFRQFGLLINPHLYGSNTKISSSNANTSISQTFDLNLVPGDNYTENELVFQGSSTNKTFSGFIHQEETNKVRLINVKGSITFGAPLIGEVSFTSRNVISFENPEFQPYTGDIIYVENTAKVERSEGQAESIKIFISF
jgi:hypothetical protein